MNLEEQEQEQEERQPDDTLQLSTTTKYTILEHSVVDLLYRRIAQKVALGPLESNVQTASSLTPLT